MYVELYDKKYIKIKNIEQHRTTHHLKKELLPTVKKLMKISLKLRIFGAYWISGAF